MVEISIVLLFAKRRGLQSPGQRKELAEKGGSFLKGDGPWVWNGTVDGRNPEPVGMYKTVQIKG